MQPAPSCPVHLGARMRRHELGKAKATPPYDEPGVKERRFYWKCSLPFCGRVREYIRTSRIQRPRCIHCGGRVNTENWILLAVCNGCRERQRKGREQGRGPLGRFAKPKQRKKKPTVAYLGKIRYTKWVDA